MSSQKNMSGLCAGSMKIDSTWLQPFDEGVQPFLPYVFLAERPTVANGRRASRSRNDSTGASELLVVGRLNLSLNGNDIVELFEKLAGPVKSVVLYRNDVTGAFTGKAAIVFHDPEAARKAFLARDATPEEEFEVVVRCLKEPSISTSEQGLNNTKPLKKVELVSVNEELIFLDTDDQDATCFDPIHQLASRTWKKLKKCCSFVTRPFRRPSHAIPADLIEEE